MSRMGMQENCDFTRFEGKCEIVGTSGPIGHSIDDLVEIMKIFYSKDLFEKDCRIPAIPFNEAQFK